MAVVTRAPTDEDVDSYGLTDRGKVRPDNQDQFLVSSLHKQMRMLHTSIPSSHWPDSVSGSMAFLFLVADGVGGSSGGEEASEAALAAIASYATHTIRCYHTQDPHHEDDFLEELRRSVLVCHETIQNARSQDSAHRPGSTTLTLVAAIWPRAYVVQVGDSRFYLLHDGALRQVTRDQTVAQELVDEGILTQSKADASPLSDILLGAVGGSEVHPEVTTVDLVWDDTILLCTDGLTKHVSDDEICGRLLEADSAETACKSLLDDALEAGGHDNITIVVGRLRG